MRKSGLVKNAIRGRIEGEFVELVNVKGGNFCQASASIALAEIEAQRAHQKK
jgi:hypothetical protein